jgi:hypothetical protein
MIRTLATSQKMRERERESERGTKKSGFFSPQILVKLLLPKSQKKTLDFRTFNFLYSFLAKHKASYKIKPL